MSNGLKRNLASESIWIRLLYMLLFALVYQVVELLVLFSTVALFLFTLFSGRPNTNLREFGSSLSQYTYQIFRFLTFNSERRPYPFSDWPEPEPVEDLMAAPEPEETGAQSQAGAAGTEKNKQGTPQEAAKQDSETSSTDTTKAANQGEQKPAESGKDADVSEQKPAEPKSSKKQ